MELKKFKIIGLHNETNRKRTFEIEAISNDQALELANERGLKEIIKIQEIEHLPTENQLNYAKTLKIKIPEGVDFNDISALIDRKVNNDNEPNAGLIDFANKRKLGFSKHIGEKNLYNYVFKSLEGVDKISFFIFSIYKWVANDNQANPDVHSFKDKFYQFATSLKEDGQFLKSMNKYSGQDLINFGEITQNDGSVLAIGSSTNTIAYKKVANYLSKEFGVFKTKNKKIPGTNVKEQFGSKGKGCLVFLIVGFLFSLSFLFAILIL